MLSNMEKITLTAIDLNLSSGKGLHIMKDKMNKSVILDAIGTLENDENGNMVLVVNTKEDGENTYSINEILDSIVGTKVQIKSVSEL